MVIRAVDAYLHEASKRRLQKNFSSPAATQPNTQAGDGVLPFTVFDSEPKPEPEAPIAKGLTEAINRLRDAGVKSAVMFVVEL